MEPVRLPLQRIDVFVQLERGHCSPKCGAFRNRAEFRRPLAVPARRDGVRPIDLLRSHDAGEYNGSSDGEKPGWCVSLPQKSTLGFRGTNNWKVHNVRTLTP